MDEANEINASELRRLVTIWRGRAVEAAEMACQQCRNNDLELCRYCRMEKIRREAGYGRKNPMSGMQ